MENGYVFIVTHTAHPGLLRILTSETLPQVQNNEAHDEKVIYIAHFNDLQAAQMHVHNELRHYLLDVDSHLYNVSPALAMACIEADELRHERVWMAQSLDPAVMADFNSDLTQERRKHRRQDVFWQWVGRVGIGLLILSAIAVSLPVIL